MKRENKEKLRLFVDSDGTLTEWRNISLSIDNRDDAESAAKKLFDILQTPGYFYSLNPNQNVIDALKTIINKNEIEVFILTCYPPDGETSSPKYEKDKYFDKHIPEIDSEHRIYVPYGESKNDYIPGGIKLTDRLLDDKTSNLIEFEQGGGQGIKLLNNINSTYGSWNGNRISYLRSAPDLVNLLEQIIIQDKTIQDKKPPRNECLFNYESFDFESFANEIYERIEEYAQE